MFTNEKYVPVKDQRDSIWKFSAESTIPKNKTSVNFRNYVCLNMNIRILKDGKDGVIKRPFATKVSVIPNKY